MGTALARHVSQTREVTGFSRKDLDLLNLDSIGSVLRGQDDFSTVIFTAGQTNVDLCEDKPEDAYTVNAQAPELIAKVCAERGARFIHISTDYVFDGRGSTPLKETDPVAPLGVYGQSKLAGEEAVLAVSSHFLVIRVSWLYGPDRRSFPDMVIKRALEHDHCAAIADKSASPTYSEDLAVWMDPMLDDTRYHGILHLCNGGYDTWQGYGQKALEYAAQAGLPLKTQTVNGLSRLDFPSFKAERPEFTPLDTAKYTELSGVTPRPWEEALEEYVKVHVKAQFEAGEF